MNRYDGNVRILTPHSREVFFHTRNDTNDAALVTGILAKDEYGLGRLPRLSGVAVDIGAHIGTVAIALALDNPGLRVIAVEAVDENVQVLRDNVAANELLDRVTVIEAAASAPGRKKVRLLWNYRSAENADQPYVKDSRFIANIFDADGSDADTHTVDAISLDKIMEGLDSIALLKLDCEGCEWQFLRSPRVGDVETIIGEYHNGDGLGGLERLLADTHTVSFMGGGADIGMFWAVRR